MAKSTTTPRPKKGAAARTPAPTATPTDRRSRALHWLVLAQSAVSRIAADARRVAEEVQRRRSPLADLFDAGALNEAANCLLDVAMTFYNAHRPPIVPVAIPDPFTGLIPTTPSQAEDAGQEGGGR